MLDKLLKPKSILLIILLFTLLTRVARIDYPKGYVFDEVYHAYTAKQYLQSSRDAWDPYAAPPEGVANEWTHPPLAKEFMAASMFLVRSTDAWAWRLPGALLGILSVFLVYLLGKQIFNQELVALLAAFIFSIDGLNFVQSRTGMNDIYFVAFMLASLLMFLKNKYVFSAIFWGLSLASKWSAIYLLPFLIFLVIKDRQFKSVIFLLIIPPLIYFLSYLPYFQLGFSLQEFWNLQQQMWWYHSGLKASHDYTSPWWSWPANLYPVWYFVDYADNKIGNIFASGNPLIFWFGAVAVILTLWELIKSLPIKTLRFSRIIWYGVTQGILTERSRSLLIILLSFFAFWLPWAFSPRIMFLYHYAPSVPFLSLILGYQLNRLRESKKYQGFFWILLGLIILSFIAIYPFLVGIHLPRTFVDLFFATNLSKNPF